jgi:hypothetical protein
MAKARRRIPSEARSSTAGMNTKATEASSSAPWAVACGKRSGAVSPVMDSARR